MKNKKIERVQLLNSYVDNVSRADVRDVVREHVRGRLAGYLVSLNADMCVQLDRDAAFSQAFNAATLILMDSQPLLKYARSHGVPIIEKISGSDLIDPVCSWAAEEGWSCFFLGGKDGVPEKAAHHMSQKHIGLEVAGTFSPQLGFEYDDALTKETIKCVRAAKPDILFFCCGSPKSEKFIYAHLEEMDVPFTFSIGAAIDFAAGNLTRAPKWVQAAGFEWFYRFLKEPKRLFKRYFVDSWALLGIIRQYGKVK